MSKRGKAPVPAPSWASKPLSAAERVIVLGQTGSGKTTWARGLVGLHKRVLIFDPAADYIDQAQPMTVDELWGRREALAEPEYRIAIQPAAEDEKECRAEVEQLIQLARCAGCESSADQGAGPCEVLTVWDEVGDYAPHAAFALSRLAANGRHNGLACVFVSQAAVEIPKAVRRQATRIVSFVQSHPDDLAALERQCGEEFSQKAKGWRRGEPPAVWSLASMEQ